MIFNSNFAHAKYVILVLIIALVFQALMWMRNRDYGNTDELIDLEFVKNLDEVKSIMIQEGSEFRNLSVKFVSKTNRYLIADENIEKNANVTKTPLKNGISIKHASINRFCRNLNITEFSSPEKLFENQNDCIILFFLSQIENPDPLFKPYIRTLPNSYSEYPQFFMETEAPKFENSLMLNQYKQEVIRIQKLTALAERANLKKTNNEFFTYQELNYAFAAVRSRYFDVTVKSENKVYDLLVPYIEMINHDPIEANVRWSNNFEHDDEYFTLKAFRNIEKGEQILLYYGNFDNKRLLYDYGFTLENNTYPPSNDFFFYTHNGRDYTASLRMHQTQNLINLVEDYRKQNNIELNSEKDKIQIRNIDLEVFKSALKSLKIYSNKQRIEEFKKNAIADQNDNYVNIYRSLLCEDVLIDRNTLHLQHIIEVLEGGKQTLEKRSNTQVVVQNRKYFDDLLRS